MARKRATGVVVVLTLLGTCLLNLPAHGLGLGELTARSALNQSFRADIALVQVRNLETAEIIPKLASRADFERLGVERFFFLTALDFQVDLSDRNNPVIRVSSNTAITEPYLNFVVEVLWPSGRLLKEYTVLLDPPVFSAREAEPVAASTPAPRRSEPAPDSAGSRPGGGTSASQNQAPAVTPSGRGGPGSQPGTYGRTDRHDTLWAIALGARPESGATVQQTMLAIVRLNPEAFIDGNINLLKAGYNLKLPSAADVNELSDARAVAEVARQNVAWQQRRSGRAPADSQLQAQLDAGGSTARPGTGPRDDQGSLRLISGDPGSSTAADTADGRQRTTPAAAGAPSATGVAGGANAQAAALADQLAVREEEVDRLQRDNSELRARVDSLASQLKQANDLRSANDGRIAQMEAQIEELRRLAQAGGSSSTPAAARPGADSDGGGFWVFGLLGLLVVGLLVAVLILWRRLSSDSGTPILAIDEEHLETTQVVERTPARNVSSAAADANLESTEILAPEDHQSPMDKTTVLQPNELPGVQVADAAEPTGPETSDIIGEADIYIAYGRFPQAVSFLRNALDAEPDRNDVRLKLMEVFVETRDVDAFNAEGSALLESASEEELYRARQLQAKLPGASAISLQTEGDADDVDMDATMIDTSMSVAEIARAARGPSLDLDLNLNDPNDAGAPDGSSPPLDVDLNLDDSAVTVVDEDSVDFELDIEPEDTEVALDLDALDATGGVDKPITPASLERTGRTDLRAGDESGADLGGDLGLDFDFDAPAGAEDPLAPRDGDAVDEELGEFDLSGLDLTNTGLQRAERADEGPLESPEDLESTIEKSIEKQLREQGNSGEFRLDELDFDASATADGGDGADDLSGLDLTIDGSSAAVRPVARPSADADFHRDELSADDEDGLSLTLDGVDGVDDRATGGGAQLDNDEFDLDGLDLGDSSSERLDATVDMHDAQPQQPEKLDKTVGMSRRPGEGEQLDDTIAMRDVPERLNATVQMGNEEEELGGDFDLGSEADEVQAKLELAQALMDSNDADGARDILAEVVEEGDASQRDVASELLKKLG